MSRKAYVTLLTKDSYFPGALTLERSLKSVQSRYPLVVLVTPTVPQRTKDALSRRKIQVREIQPLKPEGGPAIAGHDERFADTWTKLRYVGLHENRFNHHNHPSPKGIRTSRI